MRATATTARIRTAAADEATALGHALTALGDPTRQQILVLLSRERLNVSEIGRAHV